MRKDKKDPHEFEVSLHLFLLRVLRHLVTRVKDFYSIAQLLSKTNCPEILKWIL